MFRTSYHQCASAIAAGIYHTLAVKRDGSVIAFGDNSCGQTNVPDGLTTATFVVGGSCFSLAARNDGTVTGWGSTAPILNLSNVISLAAGRVHGLALTGTLATRLFNFVAERKC